MDISKSKISSAYSYVLKTSQLEAVLREHSFGISTSLRYTPHQKAGPVFEAHFWLPNQNVPDRRLYVVAGAVRREDAAPARRELARTVLPGFARWLGEIVALPEGAPGLTQGLYFGAVFDGGQMTIQYAPTYKSPA